MSTCRLLIPSTAAPLGASQYGIEAAAWRFRQVSARQSRKLQNDVTCPTKKCASVNFPPSNALCSNPTATLGLILLISDLEGLVTFAYSYYFFSLCGLGGSLPSGTSPHGFSPVARELLIPRFSILFFPRTKTRSTLFLNYTPRKRNATNLDRFCPQLCSCPPPLSPPPSVTPQFLRWSTLHSRNKTGGL